MESEEGDAVKHNGLSPINVAMSPMEKGEGGHISEVEAIIHQDGLEKREIPRTKVLIVPNSSERLPSSEDSKPKCKPVLSSNTKDPDDAIIPLSEESSPVNGNQGGVETPGMEPNEVNNAACCYRYTMSEHATFSRILGLIICFLFYVANLATDIAVCYVLYHEGCLWWFGLAVAFTFLPTLTLNIISYHMSVYKMIVKWSMWKKAESCIVSAVIAVLHLSQCGVLVRYLGYVLLEELEYLWLVFCPAKFLRNKEYFSTRFVEFPYVPYMFLVEAIFQCLPQLVLQLYILVEADNIDSTTRYVLKASALFTVFNLARVLTVCQYIVKNFSIPFSGLCFIYLWHLFTSTARVIAFALFATKFLLAFFLLCVCHWIIMSVWSVQLQMSFSECRQWSLCLQNIKKYLRGLLYGVVYLLCFISAKVEDEDENDSHVKPTRYFYMFFYSVIFMENTVLIILWYLYSGLTGLYPIALLISVFATFIAGILCMLVYYRYFHWNIIGHPHRWKFTILYPVKRKLGYLFPNS